MKKKSGSKIERLIKRIFKIKAWSDWDRTKNSLEYVKQLIQRVLHPTAEKPKSESFEEAMKRYKLTEQDILDRQKGLFRLSLLMLIVSAFFFIYMLTQFWFGGWLSIFVSLAMCLVALALAFRYHFWYFQFKQRRLGCTIEEWWHQLIPKG